MPRHRHSVIASPEKVHQAMSRLMLLMQVAGVASLEVELQARNAVTGIGICESSLPADGISAGASTVIIAQVTIGSRMSRPRQCLSCPHSIELPLKWLSSCMGSPWQCCTILGFPI